MKGIKLMADYQCFPLWENSPGVAGNIDPRDLPISQSLQQRLMAWAEKFDLTLNMDDPASSDFESEQAANDFRKEGDALAELLQIELGAAYVVTKKLW
ncbi:hypothetical protein [Ralstonia flaminis]|jgi:hypothetical protein|uniref:Uncharacterized protein n=1 Tax=Ralstonia flaminis TaxID=3058597 RepID=A0ABM9KCD8_9RALS|nr:hypothetical protein [Ralstonia sp. LMG 18101]CAJ0821875.1 hypothetical protein LMG18101_04775 [Ralstonia sp. LMG 18101]